MTAAHSSQEFQLTRADVQNLLEFVGYGNPAGPFWFVGMEEAGDLTPAELLTRAREFRPIDDLARAHALPGDLTDMAPLRATWSGMSRLVLRLSGDAHWRDRERVRWYQMNKLGRTDGETFLTEALPLPAPSIAHWPYQALFTTREVYRAKVLPPRMEQLACPVRPVPAPLCVLLRQALLGRLRKGLRRSELRGSRAGTSPSCAYVRRCHRPDTLLLKMVHDQPPRGLHRLPSRAFSLTTPERGTG